MTKATITEKKEIKEYDFWLYDAKSKLIMKGRRKDLKTELNTRALPSNTYFLHMQMHGDKEIIKKQVLIQN